jgi:hypothetical protein
MKVLTIKGCRDCPYAFLWRDEVQYCGQSDEPFEISIQSETPHENCKLPDLPTSEEIIDAGWDRSQFDLAVTEFEAGANYILNKIKS